MTDRHHHRAIVHQHEHTHITHYVRPGQEPTHLVAVHAHEHNHPSVEHVHDTHEDPEKEHRREAHIHDHEQPAESPA